MSVFTNNGLIGRVMPLVALALGTIPGASVAADYTASGNVGKKCSVSPTTVSVSIRKTGANTNYTIAGASGASTTVTARCNAATGGTLSVSAPVLQTNGQPFTVAVSGWGTAFNYTAGNAAASGSNAATSATVTLTVSANTSGWSNGTYTSTITLSNVAN